MSTVETCFAAFLFSDIEDSTKLWEAFADEMKNHIVVHDAIVDRLIEQCGGKVIDHAGDGVFAVFEGGDPMGCALEIQRQLQAQDWGAIGELRVRMGLHAGKVQKRGGDYRGPLVNRTARIMSTAWGSQVVVTPAVVEAFSLPPGAVLQDLGHHMLKGLSDPQPILGLVHPDLALQEFPPLRSLSAHPNNLPPQPNEFVGRKRELTQISEHFEKSARLVTLVGPGGMGKTRLALQAAAECMAQFPHGVYFVYLAPLSSAEAVVSTIAEALKFTFYSRQIPKDQLIDYLREKAMLLVLDNLEHLMDTVNLVEEMLTHAPKLKVLATSRERLNLPQETLLEVVGFDLPNLAPEVDFESHSAVRLFQERALHADPGFVWREEDKPHFVRICRLVGGLPLGIELAAAWVRVLPCQEIADEIEKKVDFLASTQRNTPERHRSLRAVFEYSWNLLDPQEKQVFSRLSAFGGTFDRHAADAIANASLLTLTQLLDKSLIRKTADGRFYVLEILRAFGQEILDQDADSAGTVKDAHGDYYAQRLVALHPQLRGAKQYDALESLQADLENIRVAWAWWGQRGGIEQLLASLDPLFLFYERRSRFQEAERLFAEILDTVDHGPDANLRSLVGKLYARRGYFLYRLGAFDEAKQCLEKGLALAEGDKGERAFVLNHLGTLALIQGEREVATKLLQQSLTLRQAAGDDFGVAASLNNLASVAYLQGDYQTARQRYRESLAISKAKQDLWSIAAVQNNLGEISRLLGELEEAQTLFEESLKVRQQLDDRWGVAAAYNNLGSVAYMRGDWDQAKALHRESLEIRKDLGDRLGTAVSLSNLGVVSFENGEFEDALELQSESAKQRKVLGDLQGAATTLCGLGKTLLAMRNDDQAADVLAEGVELAHQASALAVALEGLLTFAELLFRSAQPDAALETLAFVAQQSELDPGTQARLQALLRDHAAQHDFAALRQVPVPQTALDLLNNTIKAALA